MNCFIIYDNLFEEYQIPFFIKNDNVADNEFNTFVENAIAKAPEKDKEKTRNRWHLFKLEGLKWDEKTSQMVIKTEHAANLIIKEPEPFCIGENNE